MTDRTGDRTTDTTPTGTRQDADRTVLSVPEAAARLGVTPDAIRARLHRGTLPGEKLGNEWKVYLDSPAPDGEPVKKVDRFDQQDADTTRPVDRQEPQQDATGSQQAPDRTGDRQADSAIVAQLIAAKDETIETLRSEIDFLRDQLDQRSRELAAERERSDVIQQLALNRIPPLTAGESKSSESSDQPPLRTEASTASPEGQGEEKPANTTPNTLQSTTGDQPQRRWWEFWKP